MNKYRLTVTIKGWMNKERSKNTEYIEKESFYFDDIVKVLEKANYIDFNREEYIKDREVEIINLKIEMISLITNMDLTEL